MVSTGPPEAFNNNASSTSAHLLCCADNDKAAAEPKAARQVADSPLAASSDELSQASNDADDKKSESGKGMHFFLNSKSFHEVFFVTFDEYVFSKMLTEKCSFGNVHLQFRANRWCLLHLIHRNLAPLCAQRLSACSKKQTACFCSLYSAARAEAWPGELQLVYQTYFLYSAMRTYLAAIANEFC